MQQLKRSIEACNAASGDGGTVGPMIGNVGHTNLHYGNIMTDVRTLGLVPPSS